MGAVFAPHQKFNINNAYTHSRANCHWCLQNMSICIFILC